VYGGFQLAFPFANLQGDAVRYFSDRRYSTDGLFAAAPFNPLPSWIGTGFVTQPATENLHVTLSLASNPDNFFIGPFGTVVLTSGNGPSQSFAPACQDGILYGFVTNAGITTLYAMSLVEVQNIVN